FARSYGPGRYERSYEDWAVDYPIGQVRWSEGRNLAAFLGLLASKRLQVEDLITHRFPFQDAENAYGTLADSSASYLGIELVYPKERSARLRPPTPPLRSRTGEGIGIIGAGNFATGVLVPALKEAGLTDFVAVTSAKGLSARQLAKSTSFQRVAVDAKAVVADPGVDIVVIASPHDTHSGFAIDALNAGKHVFCEKPLATTMDDLKSVTDTWRRTGGHLMVGFNRRHSPAVARAREVLGRLGDPLVITIRVNAGSLPSAHWYHDRRQGGRVLGEVCHFVDTASALTGTRVARVAALGSGRGEALLDEDVGLLAQYADGSVATIAYAAGGHPAAPKERIEILGRGHSVVIDDFNELVIDARRERLPGGQNKGHAAQLVTFRSACQYGGDAGATEACLHSMQTTLAAVQALLQGVTVNVAEPR
ncbi:MAG: Gfo/Idh/MocA family oxidoreductase, partial [Actinomycetota bacterium]|nr:Gfo/Idh/MocA family oxidoreductase [Actinomycetota bacterium]